MSIKQTSNEQIAHNKTEIVKKVGKVETLFLNQEKKNSFNKDKNQPPQNETQRNRKTMENFELWAMTCLSKGIM